MAILTELEGIQAIEALKANPGLLNAAPSGVATKGVAVKGVAVKGAAVKGVAAKGAMLKGIEIEGLGIAGKGAAGKGAAGVAKTVAAGGATGATGTAIAAKSAVGGAFLSGVGHTIGLGALGVWGPVLLGGVLAAGIYGYMKSRQQTDAELADSVA
jgi:hypothetical protein